MRQRLIPWWGVPVRIATGLAVSAYMRTAYRVRRFGSLPKRFGSTLIIANHQIELDLLHPNAYFFLAGGRRSPVLTAAAKLMREPGFMAIRIPWLWRLLHGTTLDWLFDGLGLLPIENQLQSRPIARWVWAVQRSHGVLPLAEIFKPAILERFGLSGLQSSDLFTARYFRRAQSAYARISELQPGFANEQIEITRRGVEEDLRGIQTALARGGTFFVTPEGEYSRDGAIQRFRAIWKTLEPHAQNIFLVAISFDPFTLGRLSQLYRILPLRDRQAVVAELQAARPVMVSALLSSWLLGRPGPFHENDAIREVETALRELPRELFVDPELRANPSRLTRNALRGMRERGLLRETEPDLFELCEHRRHANFPGVEDIVAFHARFHSETLAAAEELKAAAKP